MSFSVSFERNRLELWREGKRVEVTLQVLYKYIYTFIIARIPLFPSRRIGYRELAAGVARPFDDDLYRVSS